MPTHIDSFNPPPEYFDHEIEQKKNLRKLKNPDDLIQNEFNRLM